MAVANSFVERVRGPESLGIEMFKSIRNDVLDCGGCHTLPPWDGSQWHVTSMFDHEPTVSQNLKCPMINVAAINCVPAVGLWHECDVPAAPSNVCYRG